MKKVMIFGTFDGIHAGHRSLFIQAKKYGDDLIVVVARDETVRAVKRKPPLYTENERLLALMQEEEIGGVIMGSRGNKYQVIQIHKPDIICLGYDQRHFTDELSQKLKDMGLSHVEIVRLEAYKPEIYKSSLLNHTEKI